MKKQLLLIALFSVGLALIEACSCFTSCGCGGAADAPDYFDFKRITSETKQGIGTESLRILLTPDSIDYLAAVVPTFNRIGFITTATACSPEIPGESGMKYPITKIDITADQPFNDTLPAGASLNALFLMNTEPYIPELNKELGSSELAPLDAVGTFSPFRSGETGLFMVLSREWPSNPVSPFKFTITLTKNDGSTISVTSGEVSF